MNSSANDEARPLLRIVSPGLAEIEIKQSTFRSACLPIADLDAAEAVLASFRHRHRRASHVCYAIRLFDKAGVERIRSDDAGEPSGSAGRPILAAIGEARLAAALVAVARVFGGIKLGIGGLKRAYHKAAREAIATAVTEPLPGARIRIAVEVSYPLLRDLERISVELGGRLVDLAFTDRVAGILDLPKEQQDEARKRIAILALRERP